MTGHVFEDDGKGGLTFVGDFEALYGDDADPWGQSGGREDNASYYRFSRHRLAMALTALCGKIEGEALEIGCGHGHAMNAVAKAIGGKWTGVDISNSAVEKARTFYPSHRFHVSDIRGGGMVFPPSALCSFEVVILSQVLWYILDHLEEATRNGIRLTKVGGLFVVSQAFLREQMYGKDKIDGFHGALNYFTTRFPNLKLIEARYDDTDAHIHHDGLMIFRRTSL